MGPRSYLRFQHAFQCLHRGSFDTLAVALDVGPSALRRSFEMSLLERPALTRAVKMTLSPNDVHASVGHAELIWRGLRRNGRADASTSEALAHLRLLLFLKPPSTLTFTVHVRTETFYDIGLPVEPQCMAHHTHPSVFVSQLLDRFLSRELLSDYRTQEPYQRFVISAHFGYESPFSTQLQATSESAFCTYRAIAALVIMRFEAFLHILHTCAGTHQRFSADKRVQMTCFRSRLEQLGMAEQLQLIRSDVFDETSGHSLLVFPGAHRDVDYSMMKALVKELIAKLTTSVDGIAVAAQASLSFQKERLIC
ncbi:unnamed protein product [Vitrella brassicaformis CCMP3155]|uniref:Uncharacterized protein n=1 Tax=Vitrella brassicaformis (strain CCMP3155) TaxID=1169540 RepID=A0A0G4F7S2_VITBC|nr:unnamed protein product [Vitrella brassicaformis CCMP3155]|eukprot:CEM08580.1 unnamed protein product [Vitrella brassicaformis CCMP3155]